MKIKHNISFEQLTKYGFVKLDREYLDERGINEDNIIYYYSGYIFTIGHSRRGQFYYIIINEQRDIKLIASAPDGSGGDAPFPGVIITMYNDGLIKIDTAQAG